MYWLWVPMQTISIAQIYNEEEFAERALAWIYPLVDKIIISEGRLTPFGQLSKYSNDGTRNIVIKWIQKNDIKNKIKLVDAYEGNALNREGCEGNNKNHLLSIAEPEHGDLIIIHDFDEFFPQNQFADIIEMFRKYPDINHIPVEEYQFAYSTKLFFNASHDGRFMRYVKGAHFGSTNHFIYPDGTDITKDYRNLRTREKSGMCHLCWVKSPHLIREKVISFNRPSFTSWFNWVYLVWPLNAEMAYENNRCIPPYYGTGFAEGQKEQIQHFIGKLPESIQDMTTDWQDHIRGLFCELRIEE